MRTPYTGDAGILLLMKGQLTLGKVKLQSFFNRRFQGEGQVKNHFEYQQYPLLQTDLDGCDVDNH